MKIGVIGAAGKIGQMRVRTVLDHPKAELAAVMDMSLERARSFANGAPAFDDLGQFLGVEMDAVVISTPANVREPLCLAAFDAGLHVLSEKPLAHSLDACQRILAASKAAKRQLGAGFNMRYYPAFAFVKDAIASGRIGTLDHIRVYGGHEGLTKFVYDWEYKSEISGGGALWDVGIHMSDMARHLLGEITSVYGVASENVWNVPGSEDNAMAIFKSPSGVAAIYQATWTDWKGYKSVVEAYGSKGMVRGAYAPMENMLITMDKPGAATTTLKKRYLDIQIREKLRSWKTTALASFAQEMDEFIALVQGGTNLRISDGNAAVRAVEVAVAVGESQRTGQAITLSDLEAAK
jgi:predicted dehydrogenase